MSNPDNRHDQRNPGLMQQAALGEAYRRTTYRVFTATQPVDMRIGVVNPALDALLQTHGVRTCAFVTASNPRSQQHPDEQNALRNEAMMQSLRAEGWSCLDALGLPDRPDWTPEQSILILGITRRSAVALARRWQQNAIVYGRRGEPPELVWTG